MNKRCQWLFPVLLLCGSVLLWTPTPTFPTTPNEKKLLSALKSATTNPARQKALTNLYHYYKEEQTPYLTLSYLLKLIDTQKLTGDYAALETSYQNLGDIHQSKRQYLSALHHYFEALVFSTKIKNNRSGYVYLKISKVFRTINRKELAWKYIKKALDYTTKHKDQDLKVLVLSSYSQLYYEEEDYTNAMKFINLSLKAEKNRGKYLDTIQNLYQKSLILLKMEEGTEAMKLLKSAVDTGLETQRYQNLLPVMNQYIERLISLNHLDEATRYLGKIEDIYAPYYPYFFVYYYLEALLNEKKGHTEKALEYYRETTNRLDQYFSKLYLHQYEAFRETTEKIYSSITEFYLEQYNRTKNQLYIRKAIYFSEIKNAYINEFSQLENKGYSHFIKEKRKLEDEFLQYNKNYIRLLNHHKESTRTGNIQPQYFRVQLERYEKKLESLKKQIAELTEFILEAPITYKKYRFKDFNIASIQSKLQTGQKIIKYTVLKEHIYAFVIRKNSVGYRRLTVNTPDTVSLVRELTEPLDDFTKGNVDYLRINYNLQLAHRLYDILLQDLLETGETGGNNENNGNNETTEPGEIFIIPDKELFKLPFEALVTGYNQKELDTNVIFSEYAAAD
ncbi:MAG: hypothetical protein GY940_13775, partial [bacterium]|nr:hypothetical protein [bacterium]